MHDITVSKFVVQDDGNTSTYMYKYAVVAAISVSVISIILNVVQLLYIILQRLVTLNIFDSKTKTVELHKLPECFILNTCLLVTSALNNSFLWKSKNLISRSNYHSIVISIDDKR